jgi:osmotically-inducible protein OsmY
LWWSPFVDESGVQVTVENAVATLSGDVHNWPAWYAAQDNAFEGGATGVINKLTIK